MAAERRELEGLLAHMDRINRPEWPVEFARIGRLHGRPVALVADGPGPKLAGRAAETVREHEKMDALVSTGFCGALAPSLAACDIFVASEVVDVALALAPSSSLPFQTGKLLSVDRVVSTALEKATLGGRADAVEMEAAAVAKCALQNNLPFYAVRVVTDTYAESFPLDFNTVRTATGRFSRTRILAAALRKPVAVLPELMKLNQRTKRAAQALGDFLADARF